MECPGTHPIFLLTSEDHLFLWKNRAESSIDSLPDLEVDMQPILTRYSENIDRSKRLRGRELELLVQQWLIDLSGDSRLALSDSEKKIESLGFISAVRGSSVSAE